MQIDYAVEADLLGTGGGIANARALLGPGPALVMNAKVVADLDLPALLAEHAAHAATATMLLRDDPDPQRWGAIGVDATGRVVSILDAHSPRPPEGRGDAADVHWHPGAGPRVDGSAAADLLRPHS